ncbi:MAG TPA: hypothetical protein VE082_05130 [Desulfobaccales bacterium]|nr:hypothetical protein [Desulfobaccales bacterium]
MHKGSRQQMRGLSRSAVALLVTLSLAACATTSAPPVETQGQARIVTPKLTPSPACAAKCERRYKQAVQICNYLYNAPKSRRYHDDHWYRHCLQEAKDQYESCLEYCGMHGSPHQ